MYDYIMQVLSIIAMLQLMILAVHVGQFLCKKWNNILVQLTARNEGTGEDGGSHPLTENK